MRTVKTLLDECVLLCGGQSALAKRLNVYQQDISRMQRGDRPISGATVGLLCDLLELDGEEARRLLANAVVDAAPPEKQGVLRRAFFVSWAIGATFGLVGLTTSGDAQSTTAAERLIAEADRNVAAEIDATEPGLTKRLLSALPDIHCHIFMVDALHGACQSPALGTCFSGPAIAL